MISSRCRWRHAWRGGGRDGARPERLRAWLARRAARGQAALAVLTLALALASTQPGLAEDPPPGDELSDPRLVFPPRAADFVPWSLQLRGYHRGIIGGEFSAAYDHGQEWAPAAAALFEAFAARLCDLPGAPPYETLLAQALAVSARSGDEPMVAYACGVCAEKTGQPAAAMGYYGKAILQFPLTPYAPELMQRCVGRSMALHMHAEQRNYSAATVALRGEWIADSLPMLHDPRLADPVVKMVFAEILGGIDGGRNTRARLHAALLEEIAQGGVDPWLAMMIKGAAAVDLAWIARGSGYSSTVTDAGWKAFSEQLDAAEKCFTAAWSERRPIDGTL